MCGTEKFPEKFKAKKYKLHDHFIDKKNFHHMMTNLPEQVIIKLAFCILLSLHCCQVSEDDIEEMFKFADKDQDGKISFIEFQLMIKPQKPDESNNNYNLENLLRRGCVDTKSHGPLSATHSGRTKERANSRHPSSQISIPRKIQ